MRFHLRYSTIFVRQNNFLNFRIRKNSHKINRYWYTWFRYHCEFNLNCRCYKTVCNSRISYILLLGKTVSPAFTPAGLPWFQSALFLHTVVYSIVDAKNETTEIIRIRYMMIYFVCPMLGQITWPEQYCRAYCSDLILVFWNSKNNLKWPSGVIFTSKK